MACTYSCGGGRNIHFHIGTPDVVPSATEGQTVDVFFKVINTSLLFDDNAFITLYNKDTGDCLKELLIKVPKSGSYTVYYSFVMPSKSISIGISVLYYELLPPLANQWICEDVKTFYVMLENPTGTKWACGSDGNCVKSTVGYTDQAVCEKQCCANHQGLYIPVVGCIPKNMAYVGAGVLLLLVILKR